MPLSTNPHVRVYPSLADLPASYDDIFAAAGARSFYLSRPWFANLIATTRGPHEELRLYGIERQTDRVPLGLFVAHHDRSNRGLWPLRQLRGFSSMYTIVFGPLWGQLASDAVVRSIQGLATALAADRPRWDVVQIDSLEHDSADFPQLQMALREAGYVVQPYFHFGNWYETISEPSLDAYFRERPSKLRNTITRKSKKLHNAHHVEYTVYSDNDRLDEGIAAYDRVYAASWKVPEPFSSFTGGLIRCAAAAGCLRLGIAYIDDTPAAAQIWLVANRQATIFKLAYDERFAEHSIGSLLTLELARHVIEIDRVTEIDFGRGDDPYKRDWLAQRRERWGLVALNPRTPRGAFAALRHVGGKLLKHSIGQVLRRKRSTD